MLNGEINEFSVDSELTQIASYFAIVDNVIKASDTNKKYVISTNTCEAAPTPFKLGSWCSVPISPQGQNMVDLYNSFITVEIDLGPFKNASSYFPALPTYSVSSVEHSLAEKGYKEPGVWLGFKDSMDIVGQYQLVANGQAFYSQSFAIEESYITGLATTEQVKSVDPYSRTRHKDVWNGNEKIGTGTIMTHSTLSNTENKIKLKIDLRRFLPLATIKYLPEFVGNLELRLQFSIDGLVCAPLGFDGVAGCGANVSKLAISNASGYTGAGITNKFVPYSELEAGHVVGIVDMDYTPPSSVTVSSTAYPIPAQVEVKCGKIVGAGLTSTPTITSCKSHLACFGLDINIYNQLAARYGPDQSALSFPIQTLTFHQMNGRIDSSKLSGSTGQASVSSTAVPRFVDSIFFLFPLDANHRTCYDNILASEYSLKMGGYGTFPEVLYSTYSPEFLEVSANVFNVNNDLTGFNKDVIKSLANSAATETGFTSYDTSNFILGIPTSTDNTFQQGQSSNTTINYQLHMKFNQDSPILRDSASNTRTASSCVPMIGFLKDSVLAIQLRGGGAPPIITLDEYDITSPAQ